MSLSNEDLQAIRKVVQEVITPLEGKLEALENDVKEIYSTLSDLRKNPKAKDSLQRPNLEEKLLSLHEDLIEAASQAGIVLPSH